MPNQEVTFEAGGKTYAIRFTQNARYRLERQLGYSLLALGERPWGLVEMQSMLWAALEGGRLKHKERTEPFTLDEAGDIWDAMLDAGLKPFDVVMEAWRASIGLAPEEAAAEGKANPSAATEAKDPANQPAEIAVEAKN